MIEDANIDYYYQEYKNNQNNNSLNVNGQLYEYSIMDKYDYEKSDSYNNAFNNFGMKNLENYDKHVRNYLEQRPDIKILYDEIIKNLSEYRKKYFDNLKNIEYISKQLNYCSDIELLVKYRKFLDEQENIQNQILLLESKKCKYDVDGYNYNKIIFGLRKVNLKINSYLKKNDFDIEISYDELINDDSSISDIQYYSRKKAKQNEYNELIKQKQLLEERYTNYICSAISLKDIKDKLTGYNSSCGKVPAGEWDTWKNPNYVGEGYETGLLGSFEGPQGKETGYDSRKGAEKTNYKDPDSALLMLLSDVTDSEGNKLYPMGSFKKGGEYYYHIFGVNDDGSINWNLIDNPRFGCKMLGNYLVVGCDQRINRERGSKVMTSLGPAIVFDYGEIPDLEEDPSHIDISMDEVLFWLKDFSHNQDKQVESLAGIYDWCTPKSYVGMIDKDYEHMERNYVNNISVTFGVDFTCVFDREDFDNVTHYDSQEDFVYTMTYKQ